MSNFAAISWRERDENDIRFILLDEHTELNLCSAKSLKQHSSGRHVAQLGHFILVLSQPVFALEANTLTITPPMHFIAPSHQIVTHGDLNKSF
jgi:hypothetical protein